MGNDAMAAGEALLAGLTAEVTLRLTPAQARLLGDGAHVDVIVHSADGRHSGLVHGAALNLVADGAGARIAGSGAAAEPGMRHGAGFQTDGPDGTDGPIGTDSDGTDSDGTSRRAVISMDSTSMEAETLFRSAIVALDGIPGGEIEGISPLYHVSAIDGPDAMAAVVQLTTKLGARQLIATLGAIEASHADQLDLDLVDMEGVESDEPDCRVPWPSARTHASVLAPWLDMDPDARIGRDPVSYLLALAPDAGQVGLLSDNWVLGGTV
ncbi:2-amino-4-hydroxy-6-hydroxymethyldihydropteridine diphosphokinase [Bifidobacterium pullorum subsp. saeculare]|uniref:2-amino-4-hydroxy-6-hydroxymethyldihydropteridine diphosphokinase n=1 Tax=Bifidobacterium pullorum subsp. saeculare TaxID=78257 RepID=A0A938WY08_9BIFI|nr:2-amino-4-hydroxy-6-hydroxymethyldihydropteridine diphosphokinase [Bifidobacterium pullorum subsp. saeculare]